MVSDSIVIEKVWGLIHDLSPQTQWQLHSMSQKANLSLYGSVHTHSVSSTYVLLDKELNWINVHVEVGRVSEERYLNDPMVECLALRFYTFTYLSLTQAMHD